MSEYHTLPMALRDRISSVKYAAAQLDRANSGSFVTTSGLEAVRASARELKSLAIAILASLPREDQPVDSTPVINFQRYGKRT